MKIEITKFTGIEEVTPEVVYKPGETEGEHANWRYHEDAWAASIDGEIVWVDSDLNNLWTNLGVMVGDELEGWPLSAAAALGSIKSDKKAAAARANGLKGGRPRKTPPTTSRPRKRGPEAAEQSRRASKIAAEKRRTTCRACGAKLGEKYLDRIGAIVPFCHECGESHEPPTNT